MTVNEYNELKELINNINFNDYIKETNDEVNLSQEVRFRVNGEGFHWSNLKSFNTEDFFNEFENWYNVNNDNDFAEESLDDVNYFDIYIDYYENGYRSGGWIIMEENILLYIKIK